MKTIILLVCLFLCLLAYALPDLSLWLFNVEFNLYKFLSFCIPSVAFILFLVYICFIINDYFKVK
jgi:hypothetical protein